MQNKEIINFISKVVENMPSDWVHLTTHRLDIYNEELAKVQFLKEFDQLFKENDASQESLSALPTAYDYIRLGHPLSCVLEWTIGNLNGIDASKVISFASFTAPLLAILRKNLADEKNTRIVYRNALPAFFDIDLIHEVYGYCFVVEKIEKEESLNDFDGTTVLINQDDDIFSLKEENHADFYLNVHSKLGNVLVVKEDVSYISEIQHVRRRETVAMTPVNTLAALQVLTEKSTRHLEDGNTKQNKDKVQSTLSDITDTSTPAIIGSSGLSVQYAIMMGLIHQAKQEHPNKNIKIILPPNCYGGTNDQARRVAKILPNVSIMDLPVDGGKDMVSGIDAVLTETAKLDAVPYIIAEIPTNPRVEVPNLENLSKALSKTRKTPDGKDAVAPVFILDQTFCPNYQFLKEGGILSTVKSIAYASGSKFPSGGKCTAGYCVANKKGAYLMENIKLHMDLCDNNATPHQLEILAAQLPSMNDRISKAYENTRSFVNYIKEKLPLAKINFVSEELAKQGFTPSVFSLDLPTQGNDDMEREMFKRTLNLKLIDLMITKIPEESKFCVSYGQLKGCYWTIPATSTQGTTKEGDKDYIVRVALAPDLDLEKHKEVFSHFVDNL